jgi:hypothetical protein
MIHSHWLNITNDDSQACYEWYESVVVNYGAFCWTSGLESWCVMLSQWLWIMVCYTEPVVVNLHTMTHNHWLSITQHDSQPLAQHYTPSITITCSALHTMSQDHWSSKMHHNSQPLTHIIHNQLLGMTYHNSNQLVMNDMRQWLWIMVHFAGPVVLSDGV